MLNILKDAGITYTNARNRNSTKKGMGRRRCLNNIEEKGDDLNIDKEGGCHKLIE